MNEHIVPNGSSNGYVRWYTDVDRATIDDSGLLEITSFDRPTISVHCEYEPVEPNFVIVEADDYVYGSGTHILYDEIEIEVEVDNT
jgi:hypothetical protein